jgi:hypothetical protein
MPAELVRKGGASLVLDVEKVAAQLVVWAGREGTIHRSAFNAISG